MGKRRIRLLQNLIPGIAIAGLDRREDRRSFVEKEFSLSSYASLEEAFVRFSPTMLFACTAPLSHAEVVLSGLHNGCHTFSELNLDASKYTEILQTAKTERRIAFLSSTMLYREEIGHIKRTVETPGRSAYTYHIGQYLPDWHPWENVQDFFVSDPRTNACRELFAIELPWLAAVFGDITAVHVARRKITALQIDYPDVFSCTMEHETGCCGTLLIEVVSRIPRRFLRVVSEDFDITWDGTPQSLHVYDAATKFDRVPLRKDDSSLRNPQYASMISDAPYVRELAAFFSVAAGDTDLSRFYGYEEDRQILGLIDRIERN